MCSSFDSRELMASASTLLCKHVVATLNIARREQLLLIVNN